MTKSIPHQELLERVAQRLANTGTATDRLLLVRWKVIGLCQHLLGSPGLETERLIVEALDVFSKHGESSKADKALLQAVEALNKNTNECSESVLPTIAQEKREEVLTQLDEFGTLSSEAIRRSLYLLPHIRDRLHKVTAGALLAGILHRLSLVAAIVEDVNRLEVDRIRAATAILYLDKIHDAIPDTLDHLGLLDDDFALRIVLGELGEQSDDNMLHWAERISALWDDLPFLRGVQLEDARGPLATTWLDRLNSYVSYTHALEGDDKPLILVQPSVECTPIHPIVSLIGLLVLDGLTSSEDLLNSLQEGQTYEIDGKFYASFEGFSGPPVSGWLRLRFQDCICIRPPNLADRMVASQNNHLSSAKTFSAQIQSNDAEPIQKFFNWDDAIGAGSISARVLLVTSRQRGTQLFDGISSNGIGLLEDGLIRFAGLTPNLDIIRGGLVLVVPNLTVARQLVEYGVDVHAIIVDGYERLHRGRHDLPFLIRRSSSPPIITWSQTGYYPNEPPAWLPDHRRLHISSDDLSYILELDGDIDEKMAPSRASLWEAATRPGVKKYEIIASHQEIQLLVNIATFIREVRKAYEMPEYWQYHMYSSANVLRMLASATPAYWSDIKAVAMSWESSFKEQWTTLRTRTAKSMARVAEAHQEIFNCLGRIDSPRNTKADALVEFLEDKHDNDWRLVCDRPNQIKLAGRLFRRASVTGFEPVLLRDLGVCRKCIVVGWRSASFASRIWAHTPQCLVALVDEKEGRRWSKIEAQMQKSHGNSLLEVLGYHPHERPHISGSMSQKDMVTSPHKTWCEEPEKPIEKEALVPCVFLWLADEPEGKVLARNSRVLLELGSIAQEKPAYIIKPDDRVILGPGYSRWSPADEFTQAVVEAIEDSHPILIREVKEWRHALRRLMDDKNLSIEDLRLILKRVGVHRGQQTINGWLDLDRAAPIGPRLIQNEIAAIWNLVEGTYTDKPAEKIIQACTKLRSLRSDAGSALLRLWMGRPVQLGLEDSWLEDIVEKLRREVQVYEVESIALGEVPEPMLGWWVTPELSALFELGSCSLDFYAEQDNANFSEDDCH